MPAQRKTEIDQFLPIEEKTHRSGLNSEGTGSASGARPFADDL